MKMNAVLKMNRILAILALMFLAGSAHASGWNDYSLDIGDGYKVFRADSMQVCIVRTADSIVILDPMSYPEVGPVVAYDMKKDFILTKNAGRGRRNQFKGDTFDDVDYKRDWYFLIPKANNEPLGPYTKETFMRVLKEKGIEDVEWVEPQNPNFWTPLLGGLMFLMFYAMIFITVEIPFLAIKFFYVSIPLIALMYWGIIRLIKK